MPKKVVRHAVPLTYSNAENEAIKHELIEWLDNYKAAARESERRDYPLEPKWVSIRQEPSYDDWHGAALRYVGSNSIEDYNEMLSLVRLEHPLPDLWNESETKEVNQRTQATKALSLADVWYGARWWLAWASIVVAAIMIIGWVVNS